MRMRRHLPRSGGLWTVRRSSPPSSELCREEEDGHWKDKCEIEGVRLIHPAALFITGVKT